VPLAAVLAAELAHGRASVPCLEARGLHVRRRRRRNVRVGPRLARASSLPRARSLLRSLLRCSFDLCLPPHPPRVHLCKPQSHPAPAKLALSIRTSVTTLPQACAIALSATLQSLLARARAPHPAHLLDPLSLRICTPRHRHVPLSAPVAARHIPHFGGRMTVLTRELSLPVVWYHQGFLEGIPEQLQ
jgi:hypothetical protein